ncbi:MAG: exonuclease SbcCD subunit D [Coriobacteriales bacterium]
MRFIHTADLHLGKQIYGHALVQDQAYVLDELADKALSLDVDALLIAGDVFDRPVPSQEALRLSEKFLARFVEEKIPVYCIPGNHDGAVRLAHNSALLAFSGLHIARPFSGSVERYLLDSHGQRACIHLLPFLRPADVKSALPDEADDIQDYTDAVRVALSHDELEEGCANILLAHQFVVDGDDAPEQCESETLSVGGMDSVEAAVFDGYDYVALGHLHGRQQVRRPEVRYSGSPLKYSFSEVNHHKGVQLVEIGDGVCSVSDVPLEPLHDLREICASYEDLQTGIDKGDHEDYLHVTLKDRSLYDAMKKVRAIYPNVLKLDWEQGFSDGEEETKLTMSDVEQKTPLDLFEAFFEEQTGSKLEEDEARIARELFSEAAEAGASE